MAGRILVAVESRPVVVALRRGLEQSGLPVDVAPPADAPRLLDPARHVAAVVRASPSAGELVAALKGVDPHLSVLMLFFDEEEAEGYPGLLGADGALVGPLTGPQVAGTCGMAARLTEARRLRAAAARRHASGGGPAADLAFLKRLMLVEVRRSRRYAIPISLSLIAIDGWARISERLNAPSRASLLGELTGLVSGATRDIDIAVPFAEDRILVLMPHTESAGGLLVARRVCNRVRQRSNAFAFTVSAGVASHEGRGTVAFGALVKRAGLALGEARAAGGDQAATIDPPKRRERISMG